MGIFIGASFLTFVEFVEMIFVVCHAILVKKAKNTIKIKESISASQSTIPRA